MNRLLLGFLAWCAIGALVTLWYWYEKKRIILHRRLGMSVVELVLGPPLWPLAAFSAWIWRGSTLRRLKEFTRSEVPFCRRHVSILLKCEDRHEGFCSGCGTGLCPTCGSGPMLGGPPEHHGHYPPGPYLESHGWRKWVDELGEWWVDPEDASLQHVSVDEALTIEIRRSRARMTEPRSLTYP